MSEAEKPNNPFPLNSMPMQTLQLRLPRSPIKMDHASTWTVDKINPNHDLIIGLTGLGIYQIGETGEYVVVRPGHAMLIPRNTRFRGQHSGDKENFTGVAQHFSLDLFERGDLIEQLKLQRSVQLPNWEVLQPLVQQYHQQSAPGTTTLAQHHQFMVLLLAYLEEAFEEWEADESKPSQHSRLSFEIMSVANHLAADPLGPDAEDIIASVPYNQDYFSRVFRERLGMTPQKYREHKRMEYAVELLGMGMAVKAVAAKLGYKDPYFFSRQFKRHIGMSPKNYSERSTKLEH